MNDKKNRAIRIRPANQKDVKMIVELLYESFVEYKSMYTSEAFAATTHGVIEIENRVNNKNVWVALYNNRIAATISLKLFDERLFIRSLAVLPVVRKKGMGKELLKFAEQVALKQGLRYLELTTTPFLTDAISLYEHFGFRESGYDDFFGTSLIKMRKDLKSINVSNKETHAYNN
jgi:N-acetylglutamate synthase-like GNAT family acetyltransferase